MNDDLYRLLQNVIRLGTIAQINHSAPARVRVETGDLLTNWMPWAETRAGASRSWNPPTVGEQVLIFAPGGDLAGAVALCAVNSDDHPQISESDEITEYEYPDAARMRYDHGVGAMSVAGIKTMVIEASESITLRAPSVVLDADQATSTGKHTIEGLLTYLAGMTGDGGGSGATAITGPITHVGGDLSSNGVVLHLHVHSGVQLGGDQTGEPV